MPVTWSTHCEGAAYTIELRGYMSGVIQITIAKGKAKVFDQMYNSGTGVATVLTDVASVFPCITGRKLRDMIDIEAGPSF